LVQLFSQSWPPEAVLSPPRSPPPFYAICVVNEPDKRYNGGTHILEVRVGRIIAITNQKGGVGKTTTAVNLSACLAEAGKRVLLIDADPQGNATSGLGKAGKGAHSIYDVLINEYPAKDSILDTGYSGLKLLPSAIAGGRGDRVGGDAGAGYAASGRAGPRPAPV
jgi:Mrp family chromosome partitioning ATPase